jgi:adenylate cyclase
MSSFRTANIFGNGVNVAARLEGLAEPGGVCLSGTVYGEVKGKFNLAFDDLGEQSAKNIAEPVRAFRIKPTEPAGPSKLGDNVDQPRHDKPSIAVLAFDNMSGDPEQEYFSDGVSEDIITELSRFPELFVIARNSSFSYKGRSTKVQDIGSDLGVAYVVEGSIRKAGRRIRVTVQLVEAATGNHIWAERYDRELEDIFDLQDEITQAIVTVLPVRLQDALIASSRKKSGANLSAYDHFMRARWLYVQSHGQARGEVLELLATAIETDPDCAHAYAYIANVHAYSVYTFNPMGADPTIAALENMERALATGEVDHFIHVQAADVYMTCGKHELARVHCDKAMALNPNDISALILQGSLIAYTGNPMEGVRLLNVALGRDPLAPDFYFEDLAEAYYMLRDYEKAISIFRRWQDPPVHTYTHLAACYAQQGRMDAAFEAANKFNESRPEGSDFAFYAAAHARLCERREDADHWLEGYRKAGLID